jgi:hypothetical protein
VCNALPMDAEPAATQQAIALITLKTLQFMSHCEKKLAGLLVSSAPTPLMWGFFFIIVLGWFTSTNDTHR